MNWESINPDLIPPALSIAVIELGFYGRIASSTHRRTVQPAQRQYRSTFSQDRAPAVARCSHQRRKAGADPAPAGADPENSG